MTGFLAGMEMEQLTRGDGAQKVCLPKGINGYQVKTVFESFMRDNPKLQTGDSNLPIFMGLALFLAYPCPGTMPPTCVPK